MTYKVCLDAGHGGNDPGAVNSALGLKESALALKVTLKTGEILKNRGFNVVYTRTGNYRHSNDLGTDLTTRAQMSNNNGCDAFVSIHLNSATSSNAYGVETFSYNGAYTPQLAESIHRNIISSGLYYADRGTKRANFAVLRETYCIAALVEMAFISNARDAKLVMDNINGFAQAITNGICDYFGVKKEADPMARLTNEEVDFLKQLYKDSKENAPSPWAKDAWEKGTEAGLVDGKRPKAPISRQEYVASRLREEKE